MLKLVRWNTTIYLNDDTKPCYRFILLLCPFIMLLLDFLSSLTPKLCACKYMPPLSWWRIFAFIIKRVSIFDLWSMKVKTIDKSLFYLRKGDLETKKPFMAGIFSIRVDIYLISCWDLGSRNKVRKINIWVEYIFHCPISSWTFLKYCKWVSKLTFSWFRLYKKFSIGSWKGIRIIRTPLKIIEISILW